MSSERLTPVAEREMSEITQLLGQLSSTHTSGDKAKKVASDIVQGTKSVFDLIKHVAKLHPAAEVALDLELQHQENDAQIVAVHAKMVKTVYHLKVLNELPADEEKILEEGMRSLFSNMAETIRNFAKFLFAHHHKSKLEDFTKRFQLHREEMEDMFKSTAHVHLGKISDDTSEILRILHALQPQPPKAAQDIIARAGGVDTVMKDPKLVDKVAKTFDERASFSMKKILAEGHPALLDKHQYVLTLSPGADDPPCSSTLHQAYVVAIPQLRLRVQEGHHEIIHDKVFRTLWHSEVFALNRVGGPRSSREPSTTTWSSNVLTTWSLTPSTGRWNHSAIGDVIDEDGSGHITALELNAFAEAENRRLPGWSSPQWFAFWACGWYNNNAWYYRKIDGMMQDLADAIKGRKSMKPKASWITFKSILASLRPLVLVADVEDLSGIVEVPPELRVIQENFREFEEKKIEDALNQHGTHLTDKASIMAVVGDRRIELHMMPLLYLLTKRVSELVKRALLQGYIHNHDICGIEELAMSCMVIFVAFDNRLRDLSQGWRFEAKDIAVQVDRYADGLFKKYYNQPWEYRNPYQTLHQSIHGAATLPLHLTPMFRTPKSVSSVAEIK
ncbi:hypothetical protein C8Q77DRAFT_1047262 [Trametes polyzona]|nr:hypothetical protein C8Q77DRAFT_1047262 [Trametes polyzona]